MHFTGEWTAYAEQVTFYLSMFKQASNAHARQDIAKGFGHEAYGHPVSLLRMKPMVFLYLYCIVNLLCLEINGQISGKLLFLYAKCL